jgi:hypothetical protein
MVQFRGGIPPRSAKMAGLVMPQYCRCDNLISRKSINFIGALVSNVVKFPELQKLEALNV